MIKVEETIRRMPIAEMLVIRFFFDVKDNADLMRCFMLCTEIELLIKSKDGYSYQRLLTTPGYKTYNMNFNITEKQLNDIVDIAKQYNELR